ncbi:Hypothetical predicted protein [Podarcis lilfordi]|uniref:Uncharacterized protein n=1 Tax=Podarcis lilfordi TaxID=74358 RepID=A0AA35JRP5_9SAUR|nr:Hypothetical predicted protein [Podarcis lilfordi]
MTAGRSAERRNSLVHLQQPNRTPSSAPAATKHASPVSFSTATAVAVTRPSQSPYFPGTVLDLQELSRFLVLSQNVPHFLRMSIFTGEILEGVELCKPPPQAKEISNYTFRRHPKAALYR